MVKEFSKEAIDNLKYYVYKLIDPRDGKVFYIGKGKNDRCFERKLGRNIYFKNIVNKNQIIID